MALTDSRQELQNDFVAPNPGASQLTLNEVKPINGTGNENENTKKRNIWQQIRDNVTVEPTIFCYLFGVSLASAAVLNLQMEMACLVNVGKDNVTCSNYDTGIEASDDVQKRTNAWSLPVYTAVPAILVLCFGSFSDRYGIRKPFFIIPIVGEVFSSICVMVCAYYRDKWPVEVLTVSSLIIPTFFGGVNTIMLAIYSYISDITTEETRTTRIGYVEIISLFLNPVAIVASGPLFKAIGYYGVFSITILLLLISITYSLFFVKELERPADQIVERKKNLCLDVFDLKTVLVDTVKVLFKKRLQHKRMLLILTYVCFILIKAPNDVEGNYAFLFGIQTYSWDIIKINYYQAYVAACGIAGMFFAVMLFTKLLKVHDYILAIIACISTIISGIWYPFSVNETMFWFGPVISIFSGLYVLALRSVVTKLVAFNEIAQVEAVFVICEAIGPSLFTNIYYTFDQATKDEFYGSFYLLTCAFMIIPLIILVVMYTIHKVDSVELIESEEQPKEEYKTTNNELQMIERF